jgi:hypothetical protein
MQPKEGNKNPNEIPPQKTHAPLILTVTIFFLASLLTAYLVIAFTPYAYDKQRAYSIPSDLEYGDSSSSGGEAFTGDFPIPVLLGPPPGATNVSRDTIVYVFETRPVSTDLHLNPETPIARIEQEWSPPASRVTILYPAELLQPTTTYNVSGSIGGKSAWWIFTTAPGPSQPRTEYILSPHVWWIAIAAATAATSIFGVTIWRTRHSLDLREIS